MMPVYYSTATLLLITLFHISKQSTLDLLNSSPVFLTSTVKKSPITDDSGWQEYVSRARVVKLEEGCGRMQNRLVTFEDGTTACARYRLNLNLMQGEIYSFYLAKLLKIDNLPPLALTRPDIKTDQWSRVSNQVLEANWQSNKLLILTKYIQNTHQVALPKVLRTMDSGSVVIPEEITPENVDIFSQWSDLIIFDYIVANMDRLINSLHNKQWNANIMESSVHNLAQKDKTLIFFDNEDGMFHGYRILDRYSSYHEQSLAAVCVFSRSTASSILKLVQSDNAVTALNDLLSRAQPEAQKYLPRLPSKTGKTLVHRLKAVADHIRQCVDKYH